MASTASAAGTDRMRSPRAQNISPEHLWPHQANTRTGQTNEAETELALDGRRVRRHAKTAAKGAPKAPRIAPSATIDLGAAAGAISAADENRKKRGRKALTSAEYDAAERRRTLEHLERLEKADTSEERQKLKSCYASFQTRRRKRKVEEGQDEKGAELARVTAERDEAL